MLEELDRWTQTAHFAQLEPEGDWRTWLFLGGRGAGKTRAGAQATLFRALPRTRIALVGPTLHDVREVMIDGPSGLRTIAPDGLRPAWQATRRRLVWDNGAEAYAFSAEDPESLRGPQFHFAWADEFCAWPKPAETLAMLRFGLRLGEDPRLVVTTTPKPMAALRNLIAEPGAERTDAPTSDNAANLAPVFLDSLNALYGGTRLAAQELEGLIVEDLDAALWRAEDRAGRLNKLEQMKMDEFTPDELEQRAAELRARADRILALIEAKCPKVGHDPAERARALDEGQPRRAA